MQNPEKWGRLFQIYTFDGKKGGGGGVELLIRGGYFLHLKCLEFGYI